MSTTLPLPARTAAAAAAARVVLPERDVNAVQGLGRNLLLVPGREGGGDPAVHAAAAFALRPLLPTGIRVDAAVGRRLGLTGRGGRRGRARGTSRASSASKMRRLGRGAVPCGDRATAAGRQRALCSAAAVVRRSAASCVCRARSSSSALRSAPCAHRSRVSASSSRRRSQWNDLCNSCTASIASASDIPPCARSSTIQQRKLMEPLFAIFSYVARGRGLPPWRPGWLARGINGEPRALFYPPAPLPLPARARGARAETATPTAPTVDKAPTQGGPKRVRRGALHGGGRGEG